MKPNLNLTNLNLTTLVLTGLLGASPAVRAGTDAVPLAAEHVQPLLIGAQVPTVDLKDGSGNAVSIGGPSEKSRIFIFYRGGW